MPTPAKVPGADEVPVVSTRLYDDDFDGFVRALGEAYERYGFVILEEHGIEQELITTAMERSKAFFACDDACKRKYVLPGLGGARGYTAFGVETAKGAQAPGTISLDDRTPRFNHTHGCSNQ
jgi:isopenicillin N synthase-like dioxygenase